VVEVEGHYHLLRGRYTGKEVAATLWPGEKNTVSVHLAAALRDITPGQAAVSYQDATVLGGRIVAR
jgi:tRNA U34 2-thiouridine synthase MnmA/TrmU